MLNDYKVTDPNYMTFKIKQMHAEPLVTCLVLAYIALA
jgi:hypothetical protein